MPPCRVACHRLRWVRWECDVWTPLRSQSCRTFLRHRRYFKQQRKPSRLCQSSLCPMKIKGKKKKKNMSMGELFSGRNSIQIKSEQRSTGTWPESFYRFPFPSSSWRRRAAKTNGGGWTELSLKAEGTIEDYKGYIGVSGIRRRRIIKLEDEGLDYLEEENEILLSSSKFFREV